MHKYRNVTNTLEEITQGAIFQGTTGNLKRTCNFFLLSYGKKITRGQFKEVPTPTISMKRVATMALAEKQNEGLIFENHTCAKVNDVLLDDEANEVFNENGINIVEVDW